MSYSLVPYLVDLAELRSAIGSKDPALLEGIIQRDPESFAADDGGEAEEEADEAEGEVTLEQALRDLVMGEPWDERSPHQYGYALERLCAHFGRRLDAEMWESIHWEVLEETGFEEILSETGSPVPLPSTGDFPSIGHLTPERIGQIVRAIGDGPLKTAAPSGRKPRTSFGSWVLRRVVSRITRRGELTEEDLGELLDEYEGWLRDAVSKGQALVFFYY